MNKVPESVSQLVREHLGLYPSKDLLEHLVATGAIRRFEYDEVNMTIKVQPAYPIAYLQKGFNTNYWEWITP